MKEDESSPFIGNLFKPVYYDKTHAELKWKKMCVRNHEKEILKQLKNVDISDKKRNILARAMSYYPGRQNSKRKILTPVFFPSWCDKNELDDTFESDIEKETNYLFDECNKSKPLNSSPSYTPRSTRFKLSISPHSSIHCSQNDTTSKTPEKIRDALTSETIELSPNVTTRGYTMPSSASSDDSFLNENESAGLSINLSTKNRSVPFFKLGKVSKPKRKSLKFIGSRILYI